MALVFANDPPLHMEFVNRDQHEGFLNQYDIRAISDSFHSVVNLFQIGQGFSFMCTNSVK